MANGLNIKTYFSKIFNYVKRRTVSHSGLTNARGDAPRSAPTVPSRSEPSSFTRPDDTSKVVAHKSSNHNLPVGVQGSKELPFEAAGSHTTIVGGILNGKSELPIITPLDDTPKVVAHNSSKHNLPIDAQGLKQSPLAAVESPMTPTGGVLNRGVEPSSTMPPDDLNGVANTSFYRTPPIDIQLSAEPSLKTAGSLTTTAPGILYGANNFTMDQPLFMDMSKTLNYHNQGSQVATISKATEQLFKHIISNAAHDSFPGRPKCCPGTRQNVNKRISSWFFDAKKEELLLWICGHAGVGKSTIVRTFADDLAFSKHLGASVFISGPKNHNDSRLVFITIAYQLAKRVEAYRNYVAESLALDPELVNKEMETQFQAFIVEPFVEKEIGAGGEAMGILLDGLDELDDCDRQQEIIALITSFISKHPRVPLAWVIASRPDSHILHMFEESTIVSTYRKEDVSPDSPESRQDVKRFLQDSFSKMQKRFPRIVPKGWPDQERMRKLVLAASGLFVFADTVVRFIGDLDYANPPVRLDQVLSMLDGISVASNPFARLDAFYTRILRSIPYGMWPTTKRVFSVLLYAKRKDLERKLESPKGLSIILSLELSMIYASLDKCISVMKIPPHEDVDKESATFYHASFGHYLLDNARSESFSVSGENAEQEVYQSLSKIWRDFQAQCSLELDSAECESEWHNYCQQRFSDDDDHNIKDSLLICIRRTLQNVSNELIKM